MNTSQVDSDALDAGAPSEPEELALAAEFPPAQRAQWSALVDQVVRKAGRLPSDAPAGAGVERLERTTPDGFRVRPLYTAADAPDPASAGVPGAAPFVRGGRSGGPAPDGWDVRQRHAEPDPAAARAAVLADLENGVTSIWLGVGTGATAVADLPAVLEGVHLDMAPVVLDASADSADTELAAAEALLAQAPGGVAPADLRATLGLDPVGRRARTGAGPDVDAVVPLARRVAEGFPLVRTVVVDALPVHGAGSSDAQELGFSLAAGVAYLRALTGAGLDLATAAGQLEFRYAATAEQFPTIAKLRAARRLWSRVTEACGTALPQFQHAVSAPSMLTRRDAHGNLLRGTVAGFGAGVGGADAVTVAPFDAALGASEPFSRRIARNTQSLLVQESHLARVIDPAGGSWFVESLTAELAAAAWAFFQEIEAAGGVLAALDSGLVAERVAAVREGRERAAARRSASITGVSEFADLAEPALARRPLPEPPAGGLPRFRPAEPYEAYRDRSDAVLAETGARPRAFLATLGPLSAYTARAGFARNLMAAGGIETPEAGPTQTAQEVATAFTEAGTPVAVLCSTDALYAERAAEAVTALREAGARQVLLAGSAEVAGVDGHLAAGCDALAVIGSVYTTLEGGS
ncbi:methylmalonyl-CoA mutase family protein [Pseudonocardia kunmingensis]|uniref:methylmalonyl-CoA mutase n=1 Tax=Pseudonocardia kunmingensis TaxID=630975 RepID=A0A543D1E8_9PSEU|nr:methylmalonyl-CoA mutase family protein [Pseudonocardia kunmingensis]TQM03176.1 heterodimeric methylmalonyl-CoA mutase small subunit [Pseudonocardia kunmingensis]